jgi:hypothetical protein
MPTVSVGSVLKWRTRSQRHAVNCGSWTPYQSQLWQVHCPELAAGPNVRCTVNSNGHIWKQECNFITQIGLDKNWEKCLGRVSCVVHLQDKVTPSTKGIFVLFICKTKSRLRRRHCGLARHFKTDPTESVALCFGYAKTLFWRWRHCGLARHFKTDPTNTVALGFGYAKTLYWRADDKQMNMTYGYFSWKVIRSGLARHFKTDRTETVALCFGYAKTPCWRADGSCLPEQMNWTIESRKNLGQSLMCCSSTEDDSLPSARMHSIFGYPKQSATVSVGSVLKWRAKPRRHAEGKLSSWVDEQHIPTGKLIFTW